MLQEGAFRQPREALRVEPQLLYGRRWESYAAPMGLQHDSSCHEVSLSYSFSLANTFGYKCGDRGGARLRACRGGRAHPRPCR